MYLWTVMKSAGQRGGCSKWPGQPRQSPSDRSWSLCAARVSRCLPTAATTCQRQTRPGCTHLPSMTAPDHEGTWRWSSLALALFKSHAAQWLYNSSVWCASFGPCWLIIPILILTIFWKKGRKKRRDQRPHETRMQIPSKYSLHSQWQLVNSDSYRCK